MSEREWVVPVPSKLADELERSLQSGPIRDDGYVLLREHVVGRFKGFKVEIFSNEHPPPHFRVAYQGETCTFRIDDCRPLNGGLKRWYRNIRKWHSDNREMLIETWNRTRPSDCPVGVFAEFLD